MNRPSLFSPSTELLIELYHRQKLSRAAIAARWGCSLKTVTRRLLEAGITLRDHKQAIKLSYATGRRQPTPGGREQLEAARKWAEEHPEVVHAQRMANLCRGRRVRSHRYGKKPSPCGWCGEPVWRHPSQVKLYPTAACCHAHASLLKWHRRHPDELRPLILQRLREGADPAEIGAGALETEAYRLERETPLLPRAIEPAPLPRPAPPTAPRKQKALAPEQIGSVGEALLRAAKKGQP